MCNSAETLSMLLSAEERVTRAKAVDGLQLGSLGTVYSLHASSLLRGQVY